MPLGELSQQLSEVDTLILPSLFQATEKGEVICPRSQRRKAAGFGFPSGEPLDKGGPSSEGQGLAQGSGRIVLMAAALLKAPPSRLREAGFCSSLIGQKY